MMSVRAFQVGLCARLDGVYPTASLDSVALPEEENCHTPLKDTKAQSCSVEKAPCVWHHLEQDLVTQLAASFAPPTL